MAGALLVPISVSAKVVKQATPVPTLGGTPFNRDSVLEPGIHVHWALPDALTSARMLTGDQNDRVLFPGVPDLWLLVRLNPLPATLPAKFKRTWRAWVVNARTESAIPLEQWSAPTTTGAADVHTVAGLLGSAASVGQAGWGLWPGSRTDFDPAVAAYYPTARKRFGFHDPVSDLQGTGRVTYVAIGWYSSREQDPLYNARDREALLRHWKLARHARSNRIDELHTLVPIQPGPTTAAWTPATLAQVQIPNPPAARLRDVSRQVSRGGSHREQTTRLRKLEQSFPAPPSTSDVVQVSIDAIGKHGGPSEIICHGAVVEVPVSGTSAAQPAIKNEQVRLYPTTNRAMAVIAGIQQTGEDVEHVEMMLDGLDYHNSTTGSVLDLPGAAHARNFQSMPGRSRFYARIDILPRPFELKIPAHFMIESETLPQGRHASGHFPPVQSRAARIKPAKTADMIKPAMRQEVKPAAPTGPSDEEIGAWIAQTRSAFNTVQAGAPASVRPLDPRLVRVQDYRKHAQPVALGHFVGGSGPNNAGWWIDIEDDAAMRELYVGAAGAIIHKPDAENLYEMPGPRWYRPWAPQVVLLGASRSYRFGEDGVFDLQGFLRCRFTGEVLTAVGVGQIKPVNGREALANGTPLSATAGLPGEVRALVEEALLLDSDSGSVLATHVAAAGGQQGTNLQSAIRGLWLSRDPALSAAARQALKAIKTVGETPSPIATTPWKDPIDPLFVDVNYAHPRMPLQTHWMLGPDQVENTPTLNAPPPPQVTVHNERSRVTSTIAKVLDSALVTKLTIDPYGNVVKANTSPKGVNEQTFKKLDILSAPLIAFDTQLFERGLRERGGALRLNRLEIVDVFGVTRKWSSGVADDSPAGDPTMPFWTPLSPRLPFWSRLQFRLQSASNINEEAGPLSPAICGFLLPDFVEHSLEVFDGEGRALGQLVSDRPQPGSTQAKVLNVEFDVHPWVDTTGDPLSAIANPVLRSLVAGLVAQKTDVPAAQPPHKWFETALTAFLRVIDTIRGTLDPTKKTHDSKIRLLGEPIVVLTTRVKLEATSATHAAALKESPPALGQTPPTPAIHIRIGDATRPDDGVLGCFLPESSPGASRFAPVSKEAAEKAVLNGLTQGIAVGSMTPVTHPFIHGLVSEFDVNVEEARDLIVLMDTRGGAYVTCGVLPRKTITLPREQLDAGLRNIEATFRAAPLLGLPSKNTLKAAAPSIDIQGYHTRFVRREPDTNIFKETRVPEATPVAELPLGRVTLTEGWMRLVPKDEGD